MENGLHAFMINLTLTLNWLNASLNFINFCWGFYALIDLDFLPPSQLLTLKLSLPFSTYLIAAGLPKFLNHSHLSCLSLMIDLNPLAMIFFFLTSLSWQFSQHAILFAFLIFICN